MIITTHRIEHCRFDLYWNTLTTPEEGYWDQGDDFICEFDDYDEALDLADKIDGIVYDITRVVPSGRSAAAVLEGRK